MSAFEREIAGICLGQMVPCSYDGSIMFTWQFLVIVLITAFIVWNAYLALKGIGDVSSD